MHSYEKLMEYVSSLVPTRTKHKYVKKKKKSLCLRERITTLVAITALPCCVVSLHGIDLVEHM